MHHAVPDELRIFQRGNHGEHPFLLAPSQMCLESHHVIQCAVGIVLPQLHHGISLFPGFGIDQAHGFHGAVPQGILAPAGHHFHGHAAFKHAGIVKSVNFCLPGTDQFMDKCGVLFLRHGAVDIVRRALIIPGPEPCLIHVNAFQAHNGRHCVIKMQVVFFPQTADIICQCITGQRTGGDNHFALFRQFCCLLLHNGDVGVAADFLRDIHRKSVTVHCQSAAGRHTVGLCRFHNQRAHAAHLFLQQTHCVGQVVAAQGIGTYQFRKIGGNVGRRHLIRFHFHQTH